MSQSSPFPIFIGTAVESKAVEIDIEGVSGFGESGVLATSLQHTLNPSTHEPGGLHTISVVLVSLLVGIGEEVLNALARTGESFMKVDWRFHLSHPKFTTRHLLVKEPSPLISFSGGLEWALNIRKSMEFLNTTAPPVRAMSLPMPPQVNNREQRKQPFASNRAATWDHRSSSNWLQHTSFNIPFPPPGLLDTPRSISPALPDDQSSVCSDLTTNGSTISDAASGISYFSPPSTRQNTSRLDQFNDQWMDKLAQQQLLDEQFQQQKRDAEALYARNGDASGLRAVLAAASQSSTGWQPSGFFKPSRQDP